MRVAVARVAGSNIVFVCAPEQATAIGVDAPNFSYPVLPTAALANKSVIAIAANAFVSAFDTVPLIEAATEPEVHMESVMPAEIVTNGGVVVQPVASVFQTDRIALRMRMPAAWALRERGNQFHE